MTFVYADIAKMLSSTDAIAHTVVVTKPLNLQFAEARVKRLLLLVFVGSDLLLTWCLQRESSSVRRTLGFRYIVKNKRLKRLFGS